MSAGSHLPNNFTKRGGGGGGLRIFGVCALKVRNTIIGGTAAILSGSTLQPNIGPLICTGDIHLFRVLL